MQLMKCVEKMENRLSQRMNCQQQPREMNGIITQITSSIELEKYWKMVMFLKKA